MRIVVDTNVIASAIFFGGKPYQLLRYIMEDGVDVVASKAIVDEYEEIVLRLSKSTLLLARGSLFKSFYPDSKSSGSVPISMSVGIPMTTSSYPVLLTGNVFISLAETAIYSLSAVMQALRY